MSDYGDFCREQRERNQTQKAKNLKSNTDVVLGYAVEYDFKIKQHSEYHMSLFHPTFGRMDYWPSTGKISWFNKKKPGRPHSPTIIRDIEAYLMKHFKPKS